MSKRPTVLMILDGYGLSDRKEGNGIANANTPVMDSLMKEYPFVKGLASGMAVGLPEGQMGNSEVGHLNMGAGRIVYQELTRITKEIEDGDFFKNEALLGAIENCKKNNSDLHLFGLLSDGGVHSHLTHVLALLELAKREGLKNVYLHGFMDGRDTPTEGGLGYVKTVQAKMDELGVGAIATLAGRYYAMDRDNRWDRVEKAYLAMTEGKGETAECPVQAMEDSYAADVTDEFVKGMSDGVYLKELDRTTRVCVVEKVTKFCFRIVLTQGLNRQIRRMCENFGYKVMKLKRIRIMNIMLGDLKQGCYRDVTDEEYSELVRQLDNRN